MQQIFILQEDIKISINTANSSDFDIRIPEGGKTFNLKKGATFYKKGYDIKIVDPEFDEESSKMIRSFVCKKINLPEIFEKYITETRVDPCSKVFEDKNGNIKLTAYYD